ncbi:MAG: hypothetical protein AVDCRST_MAG59-528 [uncultured Thermomicrobiales bacterium]|uniref:Uncharacterized protein n=1 Tax=uncultured Thermomicrobiales bacterium TaxID=1645740 RepID=A0A6J4U237_9BACT|nr:MAG: hypothetical protein AVDCRST_MAG59-528 [uncultured Thermomicrobiales bacterium]
MGNGSHDLLLVPVQAGPAVGLGECAASPLSTIAAPVCASSHLQRGCPWGSAAIRVEGAFLQTGRGRGPGSLDAGCVVRSGLFAQPVSRCARERETVGANRSPAGASRDG